MGIIELRWLELCMRRVARAFSVKAATTNSSLASKPSVEAGADGDATSHQAWDTPEKPTASFRHAEYNKMLQRAETDMERCVEEYASSEPEDESEDSVATALSTHHAIVAAVRRLIDQWSCQCPEAVAKNVFGPIFHSVSIPEIRASDYLTEYLIRFGLTQKEDLTGTFLLHTVWLIDRLVQYNAHRGFHVCASNLHRVLLTTMLLTSKMLDDESYSNEYWARVGGVSLSHLNALETFTLNALDYRLSASAYELDAVASLLLEM
eukprot:CAMPEP_0183344906 /NCGR_PEP_ID=MMETSP0164_2-20130417/10482_1 /TAXON_ID=221442 /ORGANISM="Coccolithus pelagicus ssp braarudi, Strain PLY182g" /LENGTH=263 /DNA_ID=CAMNT_0025515987 /DNA_START=8 /DNA_END=800 /DNA_ORIENTATION=+